MKQTYLIFLIPVLFLSAQQAAGYTTIGGTAYDGNPNGISGPLTAGTYYGGVFVPEGETLTIQAGAIIKMTGCEILGTLNIEGSIDNPVIFTSWNDTVGERIEGQNDNPLMGEWSYLLFRPGSQGTISRAVFRYGGGGQDVPAMIYNLGNITIEDSVFESSSTSGVCLAGDAVLNNLQFRNNYDHGIIFNNTTNSRISNCTIEGCVHASAISTCYYPNNLFTSTFSNLTLQNNLRDVIDVNGTFTQSGVIPNPGVLLYNTWWLNVGDEDKTNEEVKITFLPGIQMKSVFGISVYDELHINGSETEKVVFTSIQDDEIAGDTNGDGDQTKAEWGQWTELIFQPGSQGTISHTVFRYGGGGQSVPATIHNMGNITIENSIIESSSTSGVYLANDAVLNNLQFRNNYGHGILFGETTNSRISNCTIEGCVNASAIAMPSYPNNLFTSTFSNLTLQNNLRDVIEANGTFTQSGDIPNPGVLLYNSWSLNVGDEDKTNEEVRITFQPGIQMKSAFGIGVFDELHINGSETEKVVFTSIQDDEISGDTNGDGDQTKPGWGQWSNVIYFEGSRGSVTNAVFRYGAGGQNIHGALELHSDIPVDRCSFYSCGNGIYLDRSATIKNCRFESNITSLVSHPETAETTTIQDCIITNDQLDSIILQGMGITNMLRSTVENSVRNGIQILEQHSFSGERLNIKGCSFTGIIVSSQGTVNVNQSDITDNGNFGVLMEAQKVADFQHNYWGDPSGPNDMNRDVFGMLDELNLYNPDSPANNVTDFVNWGNPLPESSIKPISGALLVFLDGFSAIPMFSDQTKIKVFGNNMVYCNGDEVVVVQEGGSSTDRLTWYTPNGSTDIAQAADGYTIQGIFPADSHSLFVLLETRDASQWTIYKLTGPITTQISDWSIH